ncbi:uncharacterized protein LOC119349786 [Triticum dicoccoides]|uniref:Transmembrane protein 33 homolog n=1 Tax=Triticum turgidum subsp. durum TaxID=4567 RepID=A0A9R0R6S8_TRITD|nr:uncharacterized protein LOC119349786 [Triticum dicoccoides]VAH23652.1 unnamed protein product [Triticum turgidum subsp. durum]
MGGGDAGPEAAAAAAAEQEAKRAAAAAYDYEADPRWADYWSNVLVPPHLAARPDVLAHFRRKFYQRFIDRDLVVEPMSTTGSTQPSRPDIRSSPSASTESVRARNSGSSTRSAAPPPAAPQAGAANPLRFDAKTIHFSVNAWVLVVAGLGMLPILPKHLADRACKLSLLGTVLSSGYSLYSTYGKPRELNMAAIQGWLQSVLGAKDFIHLMFSLLLVTSQLHLKIAALPVFCWALDHVARFLRRNFSRSSFYRGYLEEPCLWVETNNTTLSLLSSNAELALGFLLIISLFSWRRNFIQTFMYWNVLKMMYRAPVTSSYHQSAWAKIGRTVNPYIDRYAPFLQTPISMVQRWWLR